MAYVRDNVMVYAVLVNDTVATISHNLFVEQQLERSIPPVAIDQVRMATFDSLVKAYTRGLDDGYVQGVERATQSDAEAYKQHQETVPPQLPKTLVGCGMGAVQLIKIEDGEIPVQRWFCKENQTGVAYIPCEHVLAYMRRSGVA